MITKEILINSFKLYSYTLLFPLFIVILLLLLKVEHEDIALFCILKAFIEGYFINGSIIEGIPAFKLHIMMYYVCLTITILTAE